MVYATLIGEDVLQEVVDHEVISAEKIPVAIHRTIGLHGAGFIDTNISRFARASSYGLCVVIRDPNQAAKQTITYSFLSEPEKYGWQEARIHA